MLKFLIFFVSLVFGGKIFANLNFENYQETSIPGRCYYVDGPNLKTAATLFITKSDHEIHLAPLSADHLAANYFDQKTYADILKIHGELLFSLALPIKEQKGVLFIEKSERENNFKALIEEDDDTITLTVFKNDQVYRVCSYAMRLRK